MSIAADTQRPTQPSDQPLGGLIPIQELRALSHDGVISSAEPFADGQLQPASLDLRLGPKAYRIRASFLPHRGEAVSTRIDGLAFQELDLTRPAIFERDCVYIVPLQESLDLPDDIGGFANPKSSIGRLDVFTRLIADGTNAFDLVPEGYQGPLYAEIAPQSFSIVARAGDRLSQLRLRRGARHRILNLEELRHFQTTERLVDPDAFAVKDMQDSITFSIDMTGAKAGALIGWKAKRYTDPIDLSLVDHYEPREFWDPVYADKHRQLVLDPDEFYILVSKEKVRVPAGLAAEMIPYDARVGEFRVHYAGFFDPGFGYGPDFPEGSKAVLEVRSHKIPFLMEDGQPVGRLAYEPLAATPDLLYGADLKSNYQGQGLRLSKHFKQP